MDRLSMKKFVWMKKNCDIKDITIGEHNCRQIRVTPQKNLYNCYKKQYI